MHSSLYHRVCPHACWLAKQEQSQAAALIAPLRQLASPKASSTYCREAESAGCMLLVTVTKRSRFDVTRVEETWLRQFEGFLERLTGGCKWK